MRTVLIMIDVCVCGGVLVWVWVGVCGWVRAWVGGCVRAQTLYLPKASLPNLDQSKTCLSVSILNCGFATVTGAFSSIKCMPSAFTLYSG